MGVPDFLKFFSRSVPQAFHKLPARGVGNKPVKPLEFDYVLIDATNASQTIGFEKLMEFLCDPAIRVNRAIIFALDSQRERGGSERFYRQSFLYVGDLDVKVEQFCKQLHANLQKSGRYSGTRGGGAALPVIGMSGRRVAGEGDYKLLDIHRKIVLASASAATVAHGAAGDTAKLPTAVATPSFLFISEDSDVMCGLLCGPYPASCSIATNLRDTVFNLCILRIDYVLTHIAECVEALMTEEDTADTSGANSNHQHHDDKQHHAPNPPDGGNAMRPEHQGVLPSTASAPASSSSPTDDGDVVRRRKKDGPMVAAGVRTALSDSDSDDDNEERSLATESPTAAAGGAVASVPKVVDSESLLAATVASSTRAATDPETATTALGHFPLLPTRVSLMDAAAGTIIKNSCMDLVFLFVIIMGNEANVPSLVKGVTKVDIVSCWQSYCKKKYAGAVGEAKAMGRSLLSVVDTRSHNRMQATLRLDFSFLHHILESAHYADTLSRPPVDDDKALALRYIAAAVHCAARYMVGCNVLPGSAMSETLLDSRPLAEQGTMPVPNLAAVFWVLSQSSFQDFTFNLGASDHASSSDGKTSATGPTTTSTAKHGNRSSGNSNRMELDVADHIALPVATAGSWAVRGAVRREYTLAEVLAGGSSAATTGGSQRATGTRLALPSVADCAVRVQDYWQQLKATAAQTPSAMKTAVSKISNYVAPSVAEKSTVAESKSLRNVFAAFSEVCNASLSFSVPQLRILAKVTAANPRRQLAKAGAVATVGATDTVPAPLLPTVAPKYVYSFELRRMTPILQTDDAVTPAPTAAVSAPGSASSGGAGAPSAVSAALRAAMGISLDYSSSSGAAKKVSEKGVVVRKITRKELDEEDRAEFDRLSKVAKLEKQRLAQARKQQDAKTAVDAAGTAASKTSATPKKKRLGKKERQKFLKMQNAAKGETETKPTV